VSDQKPVRVSRNPHGSFDPGAKGVDGAGARGAGRQPPDPLLRLGVEPPADLSAGSGCRRPLTNPTTPPPCRPAARHRVPRCRLPCADRAAARPERRQASWWWADPAPHLISAPRLPPLHHYVIEAGSHSRSRLHRILPFAQPPGRGTRQNKAGRVQAHSHTGVR
jgi:hypothetical protein